MYIVTYLRRFEDTKSTLIAKVDFVRLRSTNTVCGFGGGADRGRVYNGVPPAESHMTL